MVCRTRRAAVGDWLLPSALSRIRMTRWTTSARKQIRAWARMRSGTHYGYAKRQNAVYVAQHDVSQISGQVPAIPYAARPSGAEIWGGRAEVGGAASRGRRKPRPPAGGTASGADSESVHVRRRRTSLGLPGEERRRFFRSSRSILSVAFSARSWVNTLCISLTCLRLGELSGWPPRDTPSQLASILADMSRCRAALAGPIDSARATA